MRRIAFAMLVLSQIPAASAKDIEVQSAVASVVVHPDAATVTRVAQMELPAGVSTVVFTQVPFPLAPDSLRIAGQGASEITLGPTELRAAPAAAKSPDSAVATRLKELRAERGAVEVTLDALKRKLAMIEVYAQASPSADDKKPLAPAEWDQAFDAVGRAHGKTGEEIRLATVKAQELDDEINGLGAAAARLKSGLRRDVAVSVTASAPGSATLSLTYQTSAASWRPAYDAKLDTGGKEKKAALQLVRRAVVSQRTDEDWRGVALSVSTVGAQRNASAPEVKPQRVGFVEAVPVAAVRAAPAPAAAPFAQRARGVPPIANIVEATEAVAQVEASAFAATFKIAGPATAPGDGTPKSFTLSSRTMEPKLLIRAAPAKEPVAYLEARLVNDEEAPLLAGSATIERDGVFVGATRLALVAPGDSFDFGFGVDDRVKVTRLPVKRRENEPGWFGSTKTDARAFKTTVKNLHDFPVDVTVVDQAPFSENSAITVETLPQTTPPTEKQVEDKRGVMAWSFPLPPGETKEIHLAYRLKWPADREIEFTTTP